MSVQPVRVSSRWLDLREPVDGAARCADLVARLLHARQAADEWVIHDLGAGTGAMGRWLAPRLPGRQHWVLHDRDADLLALASAAPPGCAADGAAVAVERRRSTLSELEPADLAGASLITASALLDMLTEDELVAMCDVCCAMGCPILITLSVVGRIELAPPDPLDAHLEAAFNAHQRRMTPNGRLLGPDAVAVAAKRFATTGAEVVVRPSPWRLDVTHRELAGEWLTGWVGAACEQAPELAAPADDYACTRHDQLRAGRLSVTVNHADVLVLPR